MRLIVLMAVYALLLTSISLAAGLEITEIDVNVDYDEAYTYRIEDRDRVDSASVPAANNTKIEVDVLPGSNVTFAVRVENTFSGEDPAIRGVFTRIVIEEIDDGADLEGDSLDFDLEPGDDMREDIRFSIPLDVDEGTYNVIMEAEGDGKNGTSYATELNLKLEVKKQSHDIRITRVSLNPGFVDCNRKAQLTADVTNVGTNIENQIALEFKATSLGVNSYDKDISLESSNEASDEEITHTKTLNIEVPSFLKAGKFPILINLYWKDIVLFDQKSVDLVVKDCAAGGVPDSEPDEEPSEPEEAAEEPPEETEEEQPEETEEAAKQPQQEDVITATKEVSVLSSPLLLAVFLGGFVITILFLLVILLGYSRAKKAQ
ncbi:hypothetical protein HYW20_01840 [Candidatus Woesearchaeota archaeon]|nr:hypothetical protein [Candidatus Woesearchaeota archaeon]